MELLPCPFCGAGTTRVVMNGQTWTGTKYSDPISVSVVHHCDPIEGQPSRQIERIGRDAESAIAAWNRRASPASAPAGWKLVQGEPTEEILDVMFDAGIDRHDGDLTILYRAILAAAPTPPSTEDQKDAERFRAGWTHGCNALCMEIALWIERCPHCGMPAPKAPAMQEDKP